MADAFENADNIIFYKLHRESFIPENDRLDLQKTVEELRKSGKNAQCIKEIPTIVDSVVNNAGEKDIIIVMSQGGFGGIQNLIARELDKI